MRHSILICVLAAVALAAACEPSPAPTDPGEDLSIQAAAAPEGQINQLKDALFPEPEIDDASDFFAAMKSSLAQGDTQSAQDAMFDMVGLALTLFGENELLDPAGPTTTTGALIDLIQTLYQFVGFDAPDAGDLQPILDGQEDGVVGVLGPEGGTLVTSSGFAGVQFPAGAVDGDILVIIERNDVQDPSECLPTPLPQAEGCYSYDTSPDIGEVNDQDSFNEDVIAGICLDESIQNDDDYLLHKFDPETPGEGVVPLPNEPANFLDCSGFLQASRSPTWWGRLAQATRSSVTGSLVSWIVPNPLSATDRGLGGSVGAFSTIGWAEAGELSLFSGDGQIGSPGSLLEEQAVIELSRAHGGTGVIEGVDVEFEVLSGGGDLTTDGQNFSTLVTEPTTGDGIASVQWRLGSTVGIQSMVARIPGATPNSVVFTAEAADVFSNVLPASTTTDFVFRGDGTSAGRNITFDVAGAGTGLDSVRADYVLSGSVVDSLVVEPDRFTTGTKTVEPDNARNGNSDFGDVPDGLKTLRLLAVVNGGDSVTTEQSYTLDTTDPIVDPAILPPADTSTSNPSLVLEVGAFVNDDNDLTEATVAIFEQVGQVCDDGDEIALTEGTGPGEVDDQSQSVLAAQTPFNFNVDFEIQHPGGQGAVTYCFVTTVVDEALDNIGAPDGNTTNFTTSTLVAWDTLN